MSVIQGEGGVPAWIGELGRRQGLHVTKLGTDSKTSAKQRMATSVVAAREEEKNIIYYIRDFPN
jgi:hypothetical protein